MEQQIEFPPIPGTKPDEYRTVLNTLMGHITREGPSAKDLRRHMRSRSIFDKETHKSLFNLVGIVAPKSKPCKLNEFGKKLFDTDDPNEWQNLIFFHIAELNEVLVKFVFESLEERFYSVNELYRVLTSYVYPGENLTLPNFRNWMSWLEATGTIKYIGIRWGIAPLDAEVDEYLLSIDIDELLEEDEFDEDDEDDEADDEAIEAEPVSADKPDEIAPPPVSKSSATEKEDPEEELLEEDWPEPPPLPASPPQLAAVAPQVERVPAGISESMPTYQYCLRLKAVSEIQEVQKVLELDPAGEELALRAANLDEAEIAHNINVFAQTWQTASERTPPSMSTFGLDASEYKRRKKDAKGLFLYRLLVAATCSLRPVNSSGSSIMPQFPANDRFRVLEESGALTRHFTDGQPLDEVIVSLIASGHAARLDVLSLMPFLALAKQGLHDANDWLKSIAKLKTAEELVEAVYERLHAGVFDVELIWLIREMNRAKLWKAEGLDAFGVVPTDDVMDTAFRLGFVPTPYIGNFAAALYASRTLTGYFGEENGYEMGLLHLKRILDDKRNQRWRGSFFCRDHLRR